MTDPAAYLFDLDGTLYMGDAAVPGAVDALSRLRERGVPFRLVTNTTSRPRRVLLERLRRLGFHAAEGEIFTAVVAGAEVARSRGHRSLAPFVAEASLEDLAGFELSGGTASQYGGSGGRAYGAPDAVLIGDLGERWSFALLQEAFEYLSAGADLIALSRDRYYLRDRRLVLDAGVFVAGLEYASGTPATVAGKPSPAFFGAVVGSMGITDPATVAMVGDDLWSDVQGAQRAGLQGWLVRTGKYREAAVSDAGIAPDRILDTVAAVPTPGGTPRDG